VSNLLILKAAGFAAFKHRDQRRKDKGASPYINHPLKVAMLMAEIGQIDDPELLTAALLHDTVEDTSTTPVELETAFGQRIRKLVEEVSDDKSLPKAERKARQIEHARTLSDDATIIKLGDKIANVLDVTHTPPSNWDIRQRREYLDWAESVIGNCRKVNPALEAYFRSVLSDGRKSLLKITDKEHA